MNTYKKLILFFFICSFSFAAIVALINYTVDPFQHYRKSTFYQAPYINERYLNAGMAKNFPYDSVIIGTSMTENFRIPEVSGILSFSRPVKLTVGGGSIFDEATILKTAIATGKVRNVLFGLDIFCLKADPNAYPLPGYLYDNDVFNDYHYLLSLDTLKRSLTYPLFQLVFKNHPRMNYSRMYEWQQNIPAQEFNSERVIKGYRVAQSRFSKNFPGATSSYPYMKNNFDHTILPVIKQNRSIRYYIFFPPYSILEFKLLAENDALESYIRIKTYILEQLLPFANVSIFDFQTEKSITYHLELYKDTRHYTQKINHWMLEQMKENHYRVLHAHDHVDKLRSQVKDFSLPDQ